MPSLVLINGAPGAGKSTLADAFARGRPMALMLDVDGIKHSLGQWSRDLLASGLHARQQLSAGYDVVVGQYLAKTDFIDDLERLASEVDARFVEFILFLDADALADRLQDRLSTPSRPEHMINNALVGPEDADDLVQSLEMLRQARPRAVWLDARGDLSAAVDVLRAAVG